MAEIRSTADKRGDFELTGLSQLGRIIGVAQNEGMTKTASK